MAARSRRFLKLLPLVNRRRAAAQAAETMRSLHVKGRDVSASVTELSGGNQQKVVIGKWLERQPRLFILDEPTRGVDVGARAEIHRIIRALTEQGRGAIVISSEFEELTRCDRVLVIAEGQVVGELAHGEISEQAILQICYAHRSGLGIQ